MSSASAQVPSGRPLLKLGQQLSPDDVFQWFTARELKEFLRNCGVKYVGLNLSKLSRRVVDYCKGENVPLMSRPPNLSFNVDLNQIQGEKESADESDPDADSDSDDGRDDGGDGKNEKDREKDEVFERPKDESKTPDRRKRFDPSHPDWPFSREKPILSPGHIVKYADVFQWYQCWEVRDFLKEHHIKVPRGSKFSNLVRLAVSFCAGEPVEKNRNHKEGVMRSPRSNTESFEKDESDAPMIVDGTDEKSGENIDEGAIQRKKEAEEEAKTKRKARCRYCYSKILEKNLDGHQGRCARNPSVKKAKADSDKKRAREEVEIEKNGEDISVPRPSKISKRDDGGRVFEAAPAPMSTSQFSLVLDQLVLLNQRVASLENICYQLLRDDADKYMMTNAKNI